MSDISDGLATGIENISITVSHKDEQDEPSSAPSDSSEADLDQTPSPDCLTRETSPAEIQSTKSEESDENTDRNENLLSLALSHPQTILRELATGYEIKSIAGKGKGLLARVDFLPMTRIIEEVPLITCPSGARSIKEMEGFVKAAMSKIPESDKRFIAEELTNMTEDQEHHLAGVYRTNSLPCPPDRSRGAIFRVIAMANHSCVPNAVYEWVPCEPSDGDAEIESNKRGTSIGTGRLVALEHIAAGSEITISYHPLEPHATRRAALRSMFGFDCDCALCSMSKKERRGEDQRIREIEGLELTLLSDRRRIEARPVDSLEGFVKLLELYRDSRVNHERDILFAYAEVIRLCNVCFTTAAAVRQIERVCGFDRDTAQQACRDWYAALFDGDDDDQAVDDDQALEFLSRAAPLFLTDNLP